MDLAPRVQARVLALAALLVVGAALKLPTYIKTCSRNDKNINECALTNGKEAWRHLVNGDAKIKMPTLNPLRVDEIRVQQEGSVGLNLLLQDVDIFGLAGSDLRAVQFDMNNHVLEINMFIPKLELISKYNISGRILIIPIFGQGDSNITLENVPLKYTLKYDLEDRKGKDFIRIKDKSVTFDTTKAHFALENLFNGDERLRANIRKVVSENWRQVIDDIGPTVANAIAEVATGLLRNLLTGVPYDEIFPPM